MSAAAEVQSFLDQFDPPVVARARKLAESRNVKLRGVSQDVIDATVFFEEEDEEYDVRLVHDEQGWEADTEPSGDRECVALCAALLDAEARLIAGESDVTLVEPTLQETVEKKLARQLNASEEMFLAKVEKRYQRFRECNEIFDHDMVRIHAKWPIRNYDPLALWPSSPRTVWEFWHFIAVAMLEHKLPVPAFVEAITDIEGTRSKLAAWRSKEALPKWSDAIRRFLGGARSAVSRKDLRMLVTPDEVRLQIQEPSGGPWRTLAESELAEIIRSEKSGVLECAMPTRLLVVSAVGWHGEEMPPVLLLDDEVTARWLGTMLNQMELRQCIVTLDEAPFEFAEAPLHWSAGEGIATDGRTPVVRLFLAEADGQGVGGTMRCLPGPEPLYVSGDKVYRGPDYFEDSTFVPRAIEIPVEALCNEDGIRFFERLGLELPATIKQRVRHESFRIALSARCLGKAEQGGTEHVIIEAEASSTDGVLQQRLNAGTWDITKHERKKTTDIVLYDRAKLDATFASLEVMRSTFDPDLNAYRSRITKTFAEQFHAWATTLPEGFELSTDPNLQTILADPLKATVRFEVQETTMDWFDLKMIFEVEGLDLKPAEIRRLISAKGGFVRLADGSWRSVKLELTEAQRETIEGLGIDLDELDDEAHRVHLRQLAAQERKEFMAPELWERVRGRLRNLDLISKPPVPVDFKATLRPYQVEGFQFLAYLTINRFGGILADDMGLGKTMQSIAWVMWLRSQSTANVRVTLVVCPKSVLDVWEAEFVKVAPALRVCVLREKDTLDIQAVQNDHDVLVLNYAQLRGCIEELAAIEWLATVLDEGQQIKNPDSKVARAARRLKSQNRVVLTGTPLENRLLDLWSLMTFATPGALGDRAYFQKHFDRRKDQQAASRLSARLRPFLIRRTKGQVAKELPSRTEESITCEMTGLQERLYREQLAKAQHMVLSTAGFDVIKKQRFAILQALTRLRQICCHPALVQPDAINEESAKLNTLLELLEQLHDEGHKVLVFSQFVTMLNIIRDKLIELGRPWHFLSGATQNRAEVVNAFQNNPEPAVFLLSLKAGGSGLNLTAASYVILYDPWWNPAVENQAIDRAHRIGQTQPVMAYRLLARNSIEEKIQRLQHQKSAMSNDILGEEGFTRTLEQEDLEFLFDLNEPIDEEIEA
jgi:SNF2-related domain/Helicase conserved C-terminal domain